MKELFQIEDLGYKFKDDLTGYYLKDQILSLCEKIDKNNMVLSFDDALEYLKKWEINVVDVMVLVDKDIFNLTHKGLVDIPNATQSFMFMVSDLNDDNKYLEMSNFDVSKNVTKEIADALIDIKSKYGIYEEQSLENLRIVANMQIQQMQKEDYENMIDHILEYSESYFPEDTLETNQELYFNNFAATKYGVVADIQKNEDNTYKINFFIALDENGAKGTKLFDSVDLDGDFCVISKDNSLLSDTLFPTLQSDLNDITLIDNEDPIKINKQR